MAEHTPGPWLVSAHSEQWIIEGKTQQRPFLATIATVEREADAQLIATAPELLAALEKIANWSIADGSHAFGARLKDVARAAIAKARGQPELAQDRKYSP